MRKEEVSRRAEGRKRPKRLKRLECRQGKIELPTFIE